MQIHVIDLYVHFVCFCRFYHVFMVFQRRKLSRSFKTSCRLRLVADPSKRSHSRYFPFYFQRYVLVLISKISQSTGQVIRLITLGSSSLVNSIGLTRLNPTTARWAPTVIGISAIPFIIHPIDSAVDDFMNATFRKYVK